jgi:hypothetical protein
MYNRQGNRLMNKITDFPWMALVGLVLLLACILSLIFQPSSKREITPAERNRLALTYSAQSDLEGVGCVWIATDRQTGVRYLITKTAICRMTRTEELKGDVE